MALPGNAIPYGMRQVQLTPFTDASATAYAASSTNLPYSQTFTFADTEDFAEMRGDDQLVTVHGQGTVVEWELEAGGISLEAYKVMGGGTLVVTGVTPNVKKTYKKYSTDPVDSTKYTRPYFFAEGRAISDSGGDFHIRVYRARATDDLKGELKDGEFWTTGAKGQGLGSFVPADLNSAYDFIHNETPVVIP
jgi:hypothetical protein